MIVYHHLYCDIAHPICKLKTCIVNVTDLGAALAATNVSTLLETALQQ